MKWHSISHINFWNVKLLLKKVILRLTSIGTNDVTSIEGESHLLHFAVYIPWFRYDVPHFLYWNSLSDGEMMRDSPAKLDKVQYTTAKNWIAESKFFYFFLERDTFLEAKKIRKTHNRIGVA